MFEYNNSSLADILYGSEITVLGIGNIILSDEGFGVRVAEFLEKKYSFPGSVQIVDGGTLGIELTQYVTGTQKLLVIDSINGGAAAGTRFRFQNEAVMEHFQDKLSAHEVGIQDVLALLNVTGRKIPEVIVIGAQPYKVEAGVRLSDEMRAILPDVAAEALEILAGWGVKPEPRTESLAQDFGIVAEEFSELAAREQAIR